MSQIIAQGAEAVLRRKGGVLAKERIKKGYRLPQLDETLRARRTRREAALMRAAARAGINVPRIENVSKYAIAMEFVEGRMVRDVLDKLSEAGLKQICAEIGKAVAQMHEYNIIHGDLTTSNLILQRDKLFFLDFGLGFQSSRIEDKATDLRVLHEALGSAKPWEIILKAYQENYERSNEVIKTLEKIEKRGRYSKR